MTEMVLISRDDLRKLIADAVRDAMGIGGDGELLTKDQVANLLNVTSRTISNYVARNGMPHTRRGNRLMFNREQSLNWWRDFSETGHLKAV